MRANSWSFIKLLRCHVNDRYHDLLIRLAVVLLSFSIDVAVIPTRYRHEISVGVSVKARSLSSRHSEVFCLLISDSAI